MIPDDNDPGKRLNLAQSSDNLVWKRIFMKKKKVLIKRMNLKE